MVTCIWVNIDSGNGLLPDVTKTNIDFSSVELYGTHLNPVSQEMVKISIRNMSLKNSLIKLVSHLSGANELTLKRLGHFFSKCNFIF